MTPHPTPLPPRRRAVFVSDVHLGSKHCHAAELADFLGGLRCDRLYLVGDIVDLWWMAQRRATWGAAQQPRGRSPAHAASRRHRDLIYVPGNHDRPIRRFCGLVLPRMAIRRRTIHVTADGRRLLVTHGDDYDGITHFGGMQERFGDWLYYRILTGNQLLNRRAPPHGAALLVAVGVPQAPQRRGRALHRPLRPGRYRRCDVAAASTASSAATSIAPRCCGAMAASMPTTATGSRASRHWPRIRTARCDCWRIPARRWRSCRRQKHCP